MFYQYIVHSLILNYSNVLSNIGYFIKHKKGTIILIDDCIFIH